MKEKIRNFYQKLTKAQKVKIGIGVGLVLLIVVFLICFSVKPVVQEYTLELGQMPEKNPAYFLKGQSWAVNASFVDNAGVRIDEVGTYEAIIVHGFHKYTCQVQVVDTTSPTIKVNEELKYVKRDGSYTIEDFIVYVRDLGGVEKVYLEKPEGKTSAKVAADGQSVVFSEKGAETVLITAVDQCGNTKTAQWSFVVDTAPAFTNVPDYYVIPGSEVDLLQYVTAWDEVDKDVTASIVVDDSQLKLDKEGTYKVSYTATDGYGLDTVLEMDFHVDNADAIQDKINHHEINRHDQIILGAHNLYDGGLYEDDIEKVFEEMLPAIVCIKEEKANGGWSRGSGYVMEVTDEDIIIGTNAHVVHGMKAPKVHFYDGSVIPCEIIGEAGKSTHEYDIGFVKVKRADISEELMDNIKTIHISKKNWDAVEDPTNLSIGMHCIIDKGEYWLDRRGNVVTREGKLKGFESYGVFTQVGFKLQHGVSGSAVLDSNGNLICMATLTLTNGGKTTYWGVTLDHILESYEKLVGHPVNYE